MIVSGWGTEMARYRLTIEYAGTRYSGWQIQANARTIQGEIQRAVREATGQRDFELYGSGRTDAGVHALGQVAHLDLPARVAPEKLRRGINDALPSDINILSVEFAPHRFHARHDAEARAYLYQVSRRRTAFGKPLVWWVREPMDVGAMRGAAPLFVGRRDFASFTDVDAQESSTLVHVDRLEIEEDGDLVLIRIVGSHFIWKMVRRIVGVLVEVGKGGASLDDVSRFLTEPSNAPARLTAPPSGLFLEHVYYKGDHRQRPNRSVIRVGSDGGPE
jgi:tRNA pseudouridine38-40 synthase